MKKSELIQLIKEEAGVAQKLKNDIYRALLSVETFKNLSMDAQGELSWEITKLFDSYT